MHAQKNHAQRIPGRFEQDRRPSRGPVWRLPVLASALVAIGLCGAGSAEAKPAAKPKAGAAAAAKVSNAKAKVPHGKHAKATVKATHDADAADSDTASAQEGIGSWYGKYFHGRQTASGELFNMHAYTAAHRSLPIPSYARVRNLSNGREVIVRINDRGPYVGQRVIDLSMAAANRLGINGIGRVRIEPLPADAIHNGQWRIDDGRPTLPDELALAAPNRSVGQRMNTETPIAKAMAPAVVAPDADRPTAEATATPILASAAEAGDPSALPTEVAAPLVVETAARELAAEDTPDSFEAMATAPGASLPRATPTRVRSTASAHRESTAHAVAGRDAKDSKDLALVGPLPAASSPTLAVVEMGPPAAPVAAASAAAAPTALASAEGGPSAALVATAPGAAMREPGKVDDTPAAKPLMSGLLAGVAATVTPVLTGLARSATGVKETVVSLAAPITAKAAPAKPGTVQIDPARTSNGRGWWVQLGAFDESSHAMRFQHKVIEMAPWLGPLLGIFDEKGEQKLQAGPYPTREQAQRALERARDALKTSPVMVQRR